MPYINFPIFILKDIFHSGDAEKLCNDIIAYHTFNHSFTNLKTFNQSLEILDLDFAQSPSLEKRGRTLYLHQDIHQYPTTGISFKMLIEFSLNPKTKFEVQCLITFLALKSIIGKKSITKSNNNHLFARINGEKSFSHQTPTLSRHTITKIKNELQSNWHLKYYSFHTRGFFFSIGKKTSLKKLITHAEQQREKNKTNQRKQLIQNIRENIIQQNMQQ